MQWEDKKKTVLSNKNTFKIILLIDDMKRVMSHVRQLNVPDMMPTTEQKYNA